MDASKQKQQQLLIESATTAKPYEWSYVRVAEQTVINVVSAIIIGGGALVLGLIYAGWLLLLNVWHTPAGLEGILAFVLLGAVLMLIMLVVVVVAWVRGMSSAALGGMVIGAMIGAAIGAAIDSGKLKFDWLETATKAQEQKNATKAKEE